MKELIKFELKKIFTNKIVYVAAIIIFILGAVIPTYDTIKSKRELGTKEEVEAMAETYMNGDYTKDDIKSLTREVMLYKGNWDDLSKEKKLLGLCPYCFSVDDQATRDKYLEGLTSRINEIDVKSMDDSYKYNTLSKEKEMIEKLPKEENVFLGNWYRFLEFDMAADMKVILLVIGIAGIFSREYSSRVSYINLSTKNGKDKLNKAKIISALIYTTVVFIFATLISAATNFYLGLPNGDKPLSCIMNSLYNISINEYYIYTLAISYFGTLIFAMGIIVLSLLTKNIVLECGIPIFLFILPHVFRVPKFDEFIDLSKLIRGSSLLGKFTTLNVFGNAVLYPYVITSVGVIVFAIMILLYRRLGRKQSIV